jgi:ubiquinone biosynthesis accessory factor UbiK
MMKDFFQQFQQEFSRSTSESKQSWPKRELEIALQSALAKLNLVTREEFDAQTAVLQRTRQKLEALEQQLAQAEIAPQKPLQAS